MATSPAASPSRQLTVVDVYDLAAAVGKDFEVLIDEHGSEAVKVIMPKVISALEMLEAFATSNERENEQIISLNKQIERFEQNKAVLLAARQRCEMELEAQEDAHRTDMEKLTSKNKRLAAENKRLLREGDSDGTCYRTPPTTDDENPAMINLEEHARQQKATINSLTIELEANTRQMHSFADDNDKLRRTANEMERQCQALRQQSRLLVEEKTAALQKCSEQEESLIELRHTLGDVDRQRRDAEQANAEGDRTDDGSEATTAGGETLDRENMPRFTLAELRQVLHEKTELKERVLRLEELLEEMENKMPKVEEEFVVYGPMPKEPDEKLHPWKYKRQQSGVRKFFSSMWSSPSSKPMAMSSIQSARSSDDADRGTFEIGTEPYLSEASCSAEESNELPRRSLAASVDLSQILCPDVATVKLEEYEAD